MEGHAVVDVMNKFLLGALALLVCGFTVVLWLLARRSKAVAATPPSGPLTCPVCGAVLSEKDVWLGKIPCQKCGRAYRLECLRPAASVAGLSNPPWGARLEILPDRLLLYSDDGDATLAEVHKTGCRPESSLVRRSTLEDVFLRLTGRTLVE